MIDVYKIDITAEGVKPLEKILEIFFENERDYVHSYKIDENYGLMLYKYDYSSEGSIEFPCNLRTKELLPILLKWLETAVYPKHGTGDGSYEKAWKITNVGIGYGAMFAFKPEWTYYGK